MRLKFLFGILAFAVLLSSCGNKKKRKGNDDNNKNNIEVVTNSNPALLNEAKQYFELKDEFSTVEIAFNLKLESPERNLSASGQLRIANDSVIWLYVKALGFEVARAKFTRDSVAAVVKLKNSYYKGDYEAMKRYIPVAVDFSVLQSIFLNQFFIFPENKVENLDYFSFADDSDDFKLSSSNNPTYANKFGFNYLCNINKSNNRISLATVEVKQSHKNVDIAYSDYETFSEHLLPKVLKIKMDESTVTFTTTKVTFDKNLSYPLTIPASYKPFFR